MVRFYSKLLGDELELSELEVVALAHVRQVEKGKIMEAAGINSDGKIRISVFKEVFQRDIEILEKDIKDIERTGGDYYSFLTLRQAKDLLAKLVLATK